MRRVGLALLSAGCLGLTACGSSGQKMPETRGKSEHGALQALGSRGLCGVVEDEADWSAAAKARVGTVVDQDPSPGESVASTTQITLWVRPKPDGNGVFTHTPPGCGPSMRLEIHVSNGR
jgi:hypothetical protein